MTIFWLALLLLGGTVWCTISFVVGGLKRLRYRKHLRALSKGLLEGDEDVLVRALSDWISSDLIDDKKLRETYESLVIFNELRGCEHFKQCSISKDLTYDEQVDVFFAEYILNLIEDKAVNRKLVTTAVSVYIAAVACQI